MAVGDQDGQTPRGQEQTPQTNGPVSSAQPPERAGEARPDQAGGMPSQRTVGAPIEPAPGQATAAPVAQTPPQTQPAAVEQAAAQGVGTPTAQTPAQTTGSPGEQAPEQTTGSPGEQAPEQPAAVEQQAPQTPGFGERGRLRRRARFLRRARELAYRDLGGLVFDLHRFGQRNDQVVLAKLATLGHIDAELRALEEALRELRPLTVLREVGIAACPRCAAIHGSDDRFCPGCGLAFDTSAERPLSTAPITPPAPNAEHAQSPASAAPSAALSPPPAAAAAPAPSPSASPAPATTAPPVKPTAAPVAARPAFPAHSEPATAGAGKPEQAPEDEPTQIMRPPAGSA